jgi:hypothetical protein
VVKKNTGRVFVQFGKKKIKWLLFNSTKEKKPIFLKSYGWKTVFSFFNLSFGYTKKPLDLAVKIGAQQDEKLQNGGSGPRRQIRQ